MSKSIVTRSYMSDPDGLQLESLDSIRVRFGCHLFIPKGLPNCICALGKSHDDVKHIAKCIRVLWAGETAKSNIKAKIYLAEPQPRVMEGNIVVEKQNQLHNPVLQRDRVQISDSQGLQERICSVRSKNNARILTAVEDRLKRLAYARGHLRMRVNLGTFVLENYQKPENNKSCPGAREYEIKERRWLRPRTDGRTREKRPPLHIAVIDFERSDWQLEIKGLEFHEASSVDNALRSFSNSIVFQRTNYFGDIRARPEKKVVFPSSPPVSEYVEKSAIRYHIKGTKYIFEIARAIREVQPESSHVLPVQGTFAVPENQSKGFWEFIDLVRQAAELLGPTQASQKMPK
ncbi:uncharacterized protein ANIA_01206 [Aspergillus nidulans FGSC A4]|uniref:DUF7905 domain-containing protein n=1 Tax=Emericella nidulans (strain FGSC A4 / ATCC 38163 / CBS 112.46 / NRRL 194 / M139) TaxID=227321 RepID=C8VST5_EMENI|nr:hypothetical protein [Aspergillus nidulans FGSC A4]CBF87936.1 TPA: conserved hypothetical protein [Aspergillus nidulans FGSC A4]